MENRTEKITYLVEKLMSKREHRDMFLSDLHYGEEEIPFSNLCAVVKEEKIALTQEDKVIIDEIGESLWNGELGEYRMGTKYWKDIVS